MADMKMGWSLHIDLSVSDIKYQLERVLNYKCRAGITDNQACKDSIMTKMIETLGDYLPKETGAMRDSRPGQPATGVVRGQRGGGSRFRRGEVHLTKNGITYDPVEYRTTGGMDKEVHYGGYVPVANAISNARTDENFLRNVRDICKVYLKNAK